MVELVVVGLWTKAGLSLETVAWNEAKQVATAAGGCDCVVGCLWTYNSVCCTDEI